MCAIPTLLKILKLFLLLKFGTRVFLVCFFLRPRRAGAGAVPEAWVCLLQGRDGISLTGPRAIGVGGHPRLATEALPQGGADGQTRAGTESEVASTLTPETPFLFASVSSFSRINGVSTEKT